MLTICVNGLQSLLPIEYDLLEEQEFGATGHPSRSSTEVAPRSWTNI